MLDLSLFGSRRVPAVAASQQNECGLACLAAVSEYLRGELGLREIRQLAAHSGRGETLLELRNLAERIGLNARGVGVDLDGLRFIGKPAILHWEMNHFVVLERVTRRGIVIMDPGAGAVVMVPWPEVDKSFTGVALELTASARWKTRVDRPRKVSLLDFIGPLAAWRADMISIVLLSLLMELLVLVAPFQMRMSIDTAVAAADGRLIWVMGVGFGIVVLIQASVSLMRAWGAAVFGARFGYQLHDRFVRALHGKPASFFQKHHTGDILSRSRSVDAIQSQITAQLIQALLDGLTLTIMIGVMFVAVPLMAAVALAFGLLNLAATTGLRQAALQTSRRVLRAAGKADAVFLENARAARAIKLFGKETVRTAVWRNRFVELTNLELGAARLTMYSGQTAQLTAGLGNVVLISLGTWLVLGGSITLGTMMMFFVFKTFFVERLNHCVNYLMELRRVQTHAERLDEVIAEHDGAGRAMEPAAFVLPPDEGLRIEVRDVWFRYGNDAPWVLNGVNLRIEAGESVAIVGPSGCGKSTLIAVMLGLLEPERGEVLINGRNLKTISAADYARMIGVVMQNDVLFNGSVADNISFFDSPLDMTRVKAAAEKANIASEVEAMPMQYYSLLAEEASDVSGGQKQRLFIARAIYHEPRALFLDEATSHLDTGSERLVSEAIRGMKLTRILVAHRKETIATADRVFMLSPSLSLVAPVDAEGSSADDGDSDGSGSTIGREPARAGVPLPPADAGRTVGRRGCVMSVSGVESCL
jgi:ATP-binding cassette subfamily B protein RaxB